MIDVPKPLTCVAGAGGGLGPVQQLGEQPVVPRLTHPQLGLHKSRHPPLQVVLAANASTAASRSVSPAGSNDSCPRPAIATDSFLLPNAVQALDAEPDLMLGVDNVALVAVRLHPDQHPDLRRLTRHHTPWGTAVPFGADGPGRRRARDFPVRSPLPGGRPQSWEEGP